MKLNVWKNVGVYKYFFSGVSKSNDIVILDLPSIDNAELSVFGYISTIHWIENIISIKLIKNILSKNSFKFILNTIYGKKQNQNTIYKEAYLNPSTSRNHYDTHYYEGIGFNIYIKMNGGGTDTSGGTIKYRYKKNNGLFSEWIILADYFHPGTLQSTPLTVTKLIEFDDINPITNSTNIEINTTLWRNKYSGVDYTYEITPFTYVPFEINDEGNIHWFAFVK